MKQQTITIVLKNATKDMAAIELLIFEDGTCTVTLGGITLEDAKRVFALATVAFNTAESIN